MLSVELMTISAVLFGIGLIGFGIWIKTKGPP